MSVPGCSVVKKSLPMQGTQEMQVGPSALEDPLEEEMATRPSILAWKIPWTEELGRLQSMGSQSQTLLSNWAHTYMFYYSTWQKSMQSPLFQTLKDLMKSFYHTEFTHKLSSYVHEKKTHSVKSMVWCNNA